MSSWLLFIKVMSYLQWDAIRQTRVGPSHHSQDPGYLTGCHLSHTILEDDVSAFIQTGEKNKTARYSPGSLTFRIHRNTNLQNLYDNKNSFKVVYNKCYLVETGYKYFLQINTLKNCIFNLNLLILSFY